MQEIFKNATTDRISTAFKKSSGRLYVQIAGVLDGADVVCSVMTDFGEKALIATCSWRSSNLETIPSDIGYKADSGYEDYINGDIYFEIINAGVNTDISVAAYLLGA